MKAALLIILLASICLLHAAADSDSVAVFPDLDIQKLSGTWYPTAYILKNKKAENIIPFDDVIEPSGEGDILLKLRYVKDGNCEVTELDVVHTDQARIFRVPVTSETVHIVDADYESYHLVHVIRDDSFSLYLLSRTRETSEDVKTKFKNLAVTLGFDVNQAVYDHLAVLIKGLSSKNGAGKKTAIVTALFVLNLTWGS
ncbi:epididymal secretory protein 4-like [Heteronotia binoei]|uniref:epididymal secretory protein 4-like n=1 Tax=Heteronotia binoei TaxID=13085 RepID=UPI00292F39D4|nr:epididymal secretory protein 4-like [Heteronotia binoei]